MKSKVIILKTAETNCDEETGNAFLELCAEVDYVHINELKRKEKILNSYNIFVRVSGFSYGDDISAGKVLAIVLFCNLKKT